MTIPSETLYRWREAVDSMLRAPDNDAAEDMLAVSLELREAWLAALLAEERAEDERLRAVEIAKAIESEKARESFLRLTFDEAKERVRK